MNIFFKQVLREIAFQIQFVGSLKKKNSLKMKDSMNSLTQVSEAVPQRCSVNGIFKKFAKFAEKHLCQCLLFNKVAGLRQLWILKKIYWKNPCEYTAAKGRDIQNYKSRWHKPDVPVFRFRTYTTTSAHLKFGTQMVLLAGRPVTLLKKRLWHRCFPVNYVKFLRTPFLQNTSGLLLLYRQKEMYYSINHVC